MLMAGLEKNDLFIQILKTIFTISLSILLVRDYQLHAIVLIFFISNLGVNLFQFLFIYKKLNINPFSKRVISLNVDFNFNNIFLLCFKHTYESNICLTFFTNHIYNFFFII